MSTILFSALSFVVGFTSAIGLLLLMAYWAAEITGYEREAE